MEELNELFPYLFSLFFIVVWWFALAGLARMSGWATLAEHYRADVDFDGARRRFQSMSMGNGTLADVNFSNCVTLAVNTQTVGLSMLFPFRPYHPPLIIPLDDISIAPHKVMWFFKAVRITARRAPEVKITLFQSQARWLAEHSHGRWPTPAEAAAV